jgi:hypothetical protein
VCWDDGLCSTCPIEPYFSDMYTEFLCTACDFFFTPIVSNNTPILVPVTTLCPSTITGEFQQRGQVVGPWPDGSMGNFPLAPIHAFSADFKNLQIVGAPQPTDIPYFSISITAPATTNFNSQTIGIQIAAAYGAARTNYNNGSIPIRPNTTASQVFLEAWADAFNTVNYRMQNGGPNNLGIGTGLYMEAYLRQSNATVGSNNGATVQDQNGGNCNN